MHSAPTFTVLSYNVHSCIGTDRKLDVKRVADVIAESGADIVLLQELDVGRKRTGGVDQAGEIAAHLRMDPHFHPALHLEEEKYGDAILTSLPSQHLRSAGLPSLGEPRGAIWVQVTLAGKPVNIINTHLGLRRRERLVQTLELLGADWLGHPEHRDIATIFGGDLNAVPSSAVFKQLRNRMGSDKRAGRLRPTFPSRFPLLRLDHLFFNEHVELVDLVVLSTPLAVKASDHLPLLGTFRLRHRDGSIANT